MTVIYRTLAIFIPVLLGPSLRAEVFQDDFNDGNSAGWDSYSPLTDFGAPVSFSFPGGNSFRVQAPPSPSPGPLGPARGGAHRPGLVYEAFRVEVDLVDWDSSINQNLGVLGSLRSVGLGTTSGYAFSYDTNLKAFYLSRVTGEQSETLGRADLTLVDGQNYRVVLEGFFDVDEFYGVFVGEVFSVGNLNDPLITVSGNDLTYPSGTCGVFTSTDVDTGRTDATFDNYKSSSVTDVDRDGMTDLWEVEYLGDTFYFDDEDFDLDGQTNLEEFLGGSDPADPNSLAGSGDIGPLNIVVTNGELAVGFAAQDDYNYELETSLDLQNWSTAAGAALLRQNGIGTLVLPVTGQEELYLRVVGSRE